MKFENMPNNEEKTPEKAKITMKSDKAQNLEILDNFKNMQKILSENLLASNLNNNILQQEPTPHEVNERLTSLYDSFEPSTSKLKKILMTSKPQEPMNLTNYRNQSTVTSLESPGALVGGDRDKEFDSSVCDRISNVTVESPIKSIENSGSTKETPVKITNLDSTISGSLSSLSSPNVSGSGGEVPQENDANIAETPKETKVENHINKSENINFKSPVKLPGIPLNPELEIKCSDGSNRTKIFESLIDVPSFNKLMTPGTVCPPFISSTLSAKNSFKLTENVTSTLKSGIASDPDRLPIASFVSPIKSSLSAKNPEIAGILASTLSTPPSTSISGPHQSAAALAPNITAILTGTSRSSPSGNYSISNNEAAKSSIINSTNSLGTFGLEPRNNTPLYSAPSVNTSRFVPGSIVGGNFIPEGLVSKDLIEKQPINSNCIGVPLNVNLEKAEDNKLAAMYPVKEPNSYLSPGLGVTPLNNSNVDTKVITTKPAKITTTEPTTTTEEISKPLEAIKNQSQLQKSSPISKDKGKLFLCTECNNAFSRSHLFNHIKSVHNKFTCLFCYGFFVTVEKLEKHLVKKHKVTYVEFHDDESFKKYLLDSSLTINNNTNNTDQLLESNIQKQLVVTNKKTFRAVCCKCGDVLECSDLEKHSCSCNELPTVANATALGASTTSVANEECNRAGEPMDLEEPMDIDQTIGSSLLSSAQDQNIFKVAEPATGFNGSVLKHIQHSVDNYLNQQQQQQKINSSQSEEHNPIDSWRIEREPETENKLIVPKLKVKIPKFYHNQQNLFDKIESEEDSGDEDSGSDSESDFNNSSKDEPKSVESEKEEELVSYYKRKEELEERMRELENQLTKKHKRRKEKDILPEVAQGSSVAQENLALVQPPLSLKIKIRNITSNNMEAFVENITPGLTDEVQNNEKQTDIESEPMEIETQESQDSQMPEERQDDSSQLSTAPEEMPETLLTADAYGEPKEAAPLEVPQEVENVAQRKVIVVDGVQVTPVSEESVVYKLELSKGIDEIPMREFLKMCLKLMYPLCLYCNHARKIVVNGKSLALHFIQSHRFQAKVEGSEEEILPDIILAKFVENLSTMEECYFNLDTYDNFDQDKTEGHITISHDKLYECFQCRFQTHSHKELYLHNRKMHQKTLIVCLMCKINFYSYSELLCHICPGEPHKQQFLDYKFYCCLCNMDYIPSAFRLMVHLRKKHFACDVCLEKCNDQSKLSNHVWKHKLHHLCYRCGISYRNKADIMKHLFWKHGTEGITCKKCLQKKWPHVYHFCIPPSTFSCEVCNLQFTRALSLKVHRRLHENDEKYPCTEDDCEQKFISRKLLLKHVARYHFVPPVDENIVPNKEENSNSNIVIPIIPENHCCRTMPIQYRDAVKKILPLAIEKPSLDAVTTTEALEKTETLEKPQKKSKKNKNKEKPTTEDGKDDKEVPLPDLPEMQLNLSESDSSDTEEGDSKAISMMETEQTIPAPENYEALGKASNLSDSDDSDDEKKNDSENSKETVEKTSDDVIDKCDVSNPVTEELKTNENYVEMKSDNVKPETLSEPTEIKMSDSENPEEGKENLEPIKNIWENFKNFQEQQQQNTLPIVQEPKDQDDSETEERIVKNMMENVVLHVIQSDHDYAKMYRTDDESKTTDALKEIDTVETEVKPEHHGQKPLEKSPKKRRKRENSSSSSDSDSSDSDSSSSGCSCKSNCSCSSSSSSGNSSDTESSSSDDEDTSKKVKTRERETEFSTKSNDAIDVVATDDLAVTKNPADVIYESDLETDETDTDEDFYDDHPQKLASQMLTDKRLQLLQLNGEYDGIIENSRPSTPSLPPEELSLKKRIKIKKRKKDRKSSTSPMKKGHQLAPIVPSTPLAPMYFGQSFVTSTPTMTHDLSFRNISTPLPTVESHQEAEIRQLLQSHQHTQPVLPILKQLEDQKRLSDSIDSPQLSRAPSSATSSRKNSESSEPVKRSQRRRIPNKFYGYTSDDENQNATSTNPFKPIPPPNLTWRKEDLPSANKSRTQTSLKSTSSGSKKTPPCWSLVPYQPSTFSSLTQNQMEQLAPQHQQQKQSLPTPAVIEPLRIPNVPVHHINMVPITPTDPKSDVYSDSSDEEPPLQINDEPRRRKKKPSALSTSITSEAQPPPIPKLKLTIGNDNKIKRRNIKQKLPSGPPVMAARKRKIPAPKNIKPTKKQKNNLSFGGEVPMYSQKALFDDSFDTNSSFSLSQSMTIPSTSLMPPAQLMRSPLSSNVDSQDFYNYNQQQSVSQKQMEMQEQIEKQQKLEDAILKTQQYYQQYNHQQIKPQNHQPREVKEGERLYCYCQSPYDEASEMIGCDGDSCQIEWFHFECVGILVAPKGKWYCPECQKQQINSYPSV